MRLLTVSLIFTGHLLACPPSFSMDINSAQAIAYGKQIYRNGTLPNGRSVEAIGAGDSRLNGQQVTCQYCHRRSGMGSSEGNRQVPPITGDILFQDRTRKYRELRKIRLSGAGARPAYNKTALKRAIREGIDVTGRNLDSLMPRFKLSDSQLDYLIAYLTNLTNQTSPGVLNNEIRLATVLSPDTDSKLKDSVLQTMQKYFHDYNSQSRHQKQRAEHAPWHKAWQYSAYREIHLDVWQLTGPADRWNEQLTEYYNGAPVFALLNGIGMHSWQAVHDFCNKHEIPCLFPTTDYPGESDSNIYNVYFSKGLKSEAQVLSNYIVSLQATDKRVLQLYNNEIKSIATARYLLGLLTQNNIATDSIASTDRKGLETHLGPGSTKQYDVIISWTNAAELTALQDNYELNTRADRLFISSTYIQHPEKHLSQKLLGKTYLLSRFSPPAQQARQLRRLTLWAKRNNIPIIDDRITANAYFSSILIGDAIKNLRANLNRDYLLERIEHMLERSIFHSVYPELELGPGQRIASKGCFISGPLGRRSAQQQQPLHKWFIANQH